MAEAAVPIVKLVLLRAALDMGGSLSRDHAQQTKETILKSIIAILVTLVATLSVLAQGSGAPSPVGQSGAETEAAAAAASGSVERRHAARLARKAKKADGQASASSGGSK